MSEQIVGGPQIIGSLWFGGRTGSSAPTACGTLTLLDLSKKIPLGHVKQTMSE